MHYYYIAGSVCLVKEPSGRENQRQALCTTLPRALTSDLDSDGFSGLYSLSSSSSSPADQIGGAEEDRTPDLLRARQALSQLSYGPMLETGNQKQERSLRSL